MDTSSSGDTTPKKHARHGSSGRAALPRRSTRGPLDIGEIPIPESSLQAAAPSPSNPPTHLTPTTSSLSASGQRSQYATPRTQTPTLPSSQPGSNLSTMSTNPSFKTAQSTLTTTSTLSSFHPRKDFSYLLRPEIYHPLTLIDVPPPFRAAQPPTNTPLPALLKAGHFRNAAIRAAQLLTSTSSSPSHTTTSTTESGDTPPTSPSDHPTIFSLLYTRLSCLTLCNATALAAQEVKSLEDLNSSYYRDDETGKHLVPWELRVLAVRLQGMGFSDARRGVMGYYDLGRDARAELAGLYKMKKSVAKTRAEDGEDGDKDEEKQLEKEADSPAESERQALITLWQSRLHALGILVASALIEMQDLDGAARFLRSSFPASSSSYSLDSQLPFQKALLWLYLGDVDAARACFNDTSKAGKGEEGERKGEGRNEYLENQKVITALAYMADDNLDKAVAVWRELIASAAADDSATDRGKQTASGEEAMWTQNLGVCLLYLGRIDEARATLESLITTQHHSFHALTFNLCTIYELCTEKARVLKLGLVERVVGGLKEQQAEEVGGEVGWEVAGWEKVNGDFKL